MEEQVYFFSKLSTVLTDVLKYLPLKTLKLHSLSVLNVFLEKKKVLYSPNRELEKIWIINCRNISFMVALNLQRGCKLTRNFTGVDETHTRIVFILFSYPHQASKQLLL